MIKIADVEITGHLPGMIGRVVELHGRYYGEHWGLGVKFEAVVARGLGEFMGRFNPAYDRIWVAHQSETILGSISIDGSSAPTTEARLRWFILDETARGQGIGAKLMTEAMAFCERTGFQRVSLTTFVGLEAALSLYERWGFEVTDRYENSDWGKSVHHLRLDKVLKG